MKDPKMEAPGGIAVALKPVELKKRLADPFTYEGHTLEELFAFVPVRVEAAISMPAAESAKDLCRLSREIWNRFYRRTAIEGARSYHDPFFAAQENLKNRAQAIHDALTGEDRTQAATSLKSISDRLDDARLLMAKGFGHFGEVVQNRVLDFSREELVRVSS